MKTCNDLNKSTKIGLIVSTVLIVIGVVCALAGLVNAVITQRELPFLYIITDIVMLALVSSYAFKGYKKSHGNMLRYTFFAFGVYLVICGSIPYPAEEIVNDSVVADCIHNVGLGLSAILATYLGGRLDKITRNKPVIILVGGAMLVSIVTEAFILSPDVIFRTFGTPFVKLFAWAALCLAYAARYEEHKAAGQGENI